MFLTFPHSLLPSCNAVFSSSDNKRQKGWDTFPFMESWANPSPKVFPSNLSPPQQCCFLIANSSFSVTNIEGGEEGGLQVENETLRWFFPNCCLPSVSTIFVAYCSPPPPPHHFQTYSAAPVSKQVIHCPNAHARSKLDHCAMGSIAFKLTLYFTFLSYEYSTVKDVQVNLTTLANNTI